MHFEDEPLEPMVLKLPPLPDELAVRMYELVQADNIREIVRSVCAEASLALAATANSPTCGQSNSPT